MNNIFYHTRVNNERLEKMSDSDLQFLSSSSHEVIHSITAGIKSIANLASAAANSEEYSSDDAMTDLDRLSRLLSVLPLIIEAEHENHVNAIDEIRERKNKIIRKQS
ncbi:hypothetical protein [Xenorhabdus anantnagensis]|uniref:Uncharacterized protein n=1 Tax=Xenorhabdus anantnagensis TaxID=3025875 RepID=A0ABT5LSD7_9GAMM|nr:hypothetical protein [Xenorhabdus anantnagensis]MDC9597328.1 hypothetical protein [Xenorhabdus anantnagensis]